MGGSKADDRDHLTKVGALLSLDQKVSGKSGGTFSLYKTTT